MTQAECDELCLALERNGSYDVHTANKARLYVRRLVGANPASKLGGRPQAQFISAVKQALGLGKWKELRDFMQGWW